MKRNALWRKNGRDAVFHGRSCRLGHMECLLSIHHTSSPAAMLETSQATRAQGMA